MGVYSTTFRLALAALYIILAMVLLGYGVLLTGAGHGSYFFAMMMLSPCFVLYPVVALVCGCLLWLFLGAAVPFAWKNKRLAVACLVMLILKCLPLPALIWLAESDWDHASKYLSQGNRYVLVFIILFIALHTMMLTNLIHDLLAAKSNGKVDHNPQLAG